MGMEDFEKSLNTPVLIYFMNPYSNGLIKYTLNI